MTLAAAPAAQPARRVTVVPPSPTPSSPPAPRPPARASPLGAPRPAPTSNAEILRRAFPLWPGPGTPWPLFSTTLRGVLLSRKTLLLLLFMLLPAYITFIIHGSVGMDQYEENTFWGGAPEDASRALLWFQDGSFGILFPFLIPLIVAVYSTSAIGEEVEGKTLPYLFTRPVYRTWILLAKASASFLGVFLIAITGLTLFWFASVSLTQNPLNDIGQLFGHWGVAALAVWATGGVFLFLGVIWRRSIILILVYLFLFEFFFSNFSGQFFKRVSFVNYERPILRAITDRTVSAQDIRIGFVEPGAAVVILLVLGLLGLVAAFWVVSTKDYNV